MTTKHDYYLQHKERILVSNKVRKEANLEKYLKIGRDWYNRDKETKPIKYMLKAAKARAVKKDLEFSLSEADIVIPDKCPVFQRPLIWGDWKWTPSIDRIDPTKGYTKDNIQIWSAQANRMKWNSNEEELIAFAKGILSLRNGG